MGCLKEYGQRLLTELEMTQGQLFSKTTTAWVMAHKSGTLELSAHTEGNSVDGECPFHIAWWSEPLPGSSACPRLSLRSPYSLYKLGDGEASESGQLPGRPEAFEFLFPYRMESFTSYLKEVQKKLLHSIQGKNPFLFWPFLLTDSFPSFCFSNKFAVL